MRVIKAMVIGMAVLIVIGFVVIGVELSLRLLGTSLTGPPAPDGPRPTAGPGLPPGATVEHLAAAGDRLALHVRLPDGRDALYIMALDDGRILATVPLSAGPAPPSGPPTAESPTEAPRSRIP